MTEESTVFDSQSTNEAVNHAITKEQTYFSALVGESQKYKTPEELAKGYVHADTHIQELKEKVRALEEKVTQSKTIDDVLERISSDKTLTEDTPSVQPAGIKPEDLEGLVEKTLAKKQHEEVRRANLLAADAALKEKYGEKAVEVFKQQADTPEKAKVLMELAAVDPNKFVSLFAVQTTVNTMDVGSSVVLNGKNKGNRENIEGTKEWAAKIRKENPSLYWSSNFQAKFQRMTAENPSLYFGN